MEKVAEQKALTSAGVVEVYTDVFNELKNKIKRSVYTVCM